MADNTALVAAIAAVGSGGIVTAVATFIKVRPEAGKLIIESATEIVVLQRETVTGLRADLKDVVKERDAIRARLDNTETENRVLQRRVTTAENRNAILEGKVTELDASLARLREQVTGSSEE